MTPRDFLPLAPIYALPLDGDLGSPTGRSQVEFGSLLITACRAAGSPRPTARFGIVLRNHPGRCLDQPPDLRCLAGHCPCACGVDPEFTTMKCMKLRGQDKPMRGVLPAGGNLT